MGIRDKFKSAWNAFTNEERRTYSPEGQGTYSHVNYGYQDRSTRLVSTTNDRTILTSIMSRMAVDIAAINIKHVKVDGQNQYVEEVRSGLNSCLNLRANLDQSARAFRQDLALTVLDRGVAAIVPVDTSVNPEQSDGFDVKSLRVGYITAWYPRHVRVEVYNENLGYRQEIVLEKNAVAIVENPLYVIMNQPNSTLARLKEKMSQLDKIDSVNASGKLDLIVQLPYVVKTESRKEVAAKRRSDIEFQLTGSKYGIAYMDGAEKITQLNRPVENNLQPQIKDLTEQLYAQLGLTQEVMNGTASEEAMNNYMERTIKPVVDSIVEGMLWAFISQTARTQGQSLMTFQKPFQFVPVGQLAEIVDKFTRNEVMTANEVRPLINLMPSKDPKADKLQNSNMPQPQEMPPDVIDEESSPPL